MRWTGILKLESDLKDSPEVSWNILWNENLVLNIWNTEGLRFPSITLWHLQASIYHQRLGRRFRFSNLLSEADSDHNFGRGVALVKELCDGLEYSEGAPGLKPNS